jgi:hypothetical protein
MPVTNIPFNTGTYTDDSPLQAEGFFVDADKMRPVRGKYQTIGGWETASASTLLGIARGAFTWTDSGDNPFAVFGTHLRLYMMDMDGNTVDATPVIERGTLTNAFTTVSGDKTVTVSDTAHGLAIGQKVEFLTSVTVGGINMQGVWVVDTVPSANTYTFEHGSAAGSNAGPTGTAEYQYFLAPGQIDGLSGFGYGTGPYGSGGYGSPTSGYVLYPRTWTFDRWGQNVLCSPRGGSIYEATPNITTSQQLTNADFSVTDAGWTVATGWTIQTGALLGASVTGAAEQPITTEWGAWNLISLHVTVVDGKMGVDFAGTQIGTTITATGDYYFTKVLGGPGQFQLNGYNFSGHVRDVSSQGLTTAERIPGAPDQTTGVFVTDSRQVVAVGSPNADSAYQFDPMLVSWSDIEKNQTWTATPSNSAGSFGLEGFGIGSVLLAGAATKSENIIMGNHGLVSMRKTDDPLTVFDFDLVATGCGLAGPLAVAEAQGDLYWVSPTFEFFRYSAGNVTPLNCYVRRHVADRISKVQQGKIVAWHNSGNSEIWWHYPVTDNEVSDYVIYSYTSNEWTVGKFDRTTWVDASTFQHPLAVDTSGSIYYHEKDFSDDGGARSWSLTSGYFDLGDGDEHMLLSGMYPDNDDLRGGYQITVTTLNESTKGITTREQGPFNVSADTGRINFRANGQQAQIKWSATDAPTFYRMGKPGFELKSTGRRR